MKVFALKDMVNGWMVGDFDPAVYKTKNFEVGYHTYKKNAPTQNHYHKDSTEINLVVKGDVEINGKRFTDGDIFVLEPYMVSESKFYKDTELVVIRNSSNTNDKYIVNEKSN
jgi:hypothetical protein